MPPSLFSHRIRECRGVMIVGKRRLEFLEQEISIQLSCTALVLDAGKKMRPAVCAAITTPWAGCDTALGSTGMMKARERVLRFVLDLEQFAGAPRTHGSDSSGWSHAYFVDQKICVRIQSGDALNVYISREDEVLGSMLDVQQSIFSECRDIEVCLYKKGTARPHRTDHVELRVSYTNQMGGGAVGRSIGYFLAGLRGACRCEDGKLLAEWRSAVSAEEGCPSMLIAKMQEYHQILTALLEEEFHKERLDKAIRVSYMQDMITTWLPRQRRSQQPDGKYETLCLSGVLSWRSNMCFEMEMVASEDSCGGRIYAIKICAFSGHRDAPRPDDTPSMTVCAFGLGAMNVLHRSIKMYAGAIGVALAKRGANALPVGQFKEGFLFRDLKFPERDEDADGFCLLHLQASTCAGTNMCKLLHEAARLFLETFNRYVEGEHIMQPSRVRSKAIKEQDGQVVLFMPGPKLRVVCFAVGAQIFCDVHLVTPPCEPSTVRVLSDGVAYAKRMRQRAVRMEDAPHEKCLRDLYVLACGVNSISAWLVLVRRHLKGMCASMSEGEEVVHGEKNTAFSATIEAEAGFVKGEELPSLKPIGIKLCEEVLIEMCDEGLEHLIPHKMCTEFCGSWYCAVKDPSDHPCGYSIVFGDLIDVDGRYVRLTMRLLERDNGNGTIVQISEAIFDFVYLSDFFRENRDELVRNPCHTLLVSPLRPV